MTFLSMHFIYEIKQHQAQKIFLYISTNIHKDENQEFNNVSEGNCEMGVEFVVSRM